MTPDDFLNSQHHIALRWGDYQIVLGQPSSSVIVGFLACLYVHYAMQFARTLRSQQSRQLWCLGLLFSSAAAFIAGIYYQLLGFHLRCEGLHQCYATSSWEIAYYLFSCFASLCFFLAVVRVSASEKFRRPLWLWGWGATLAYVGGLTAGIVWDVSFFLSFQFSVLMTLPIVTPIAVLNLWRFSIKPRVVDKVLIQSSLMLVFSSAAYFAYSNFGITEFLWRHSIWFSENDVLHVGLIFWVWYLNSRLLKLLRDFV